MKYAVLLMTSLCIFSASAETLSGHVLQVRDNVAYVKTVSGKKVPVILDDKTYYRKRKIIQKGKESIEVYQPLMTRGDDIVLTYDSDSVSEKTGAVRASDVLVVTKN